MRRAAMLSQDFAEAYRAHVDFVWRVLARRGVPDEQLAPTIASIEYFEPIDEPDVPFDRIREHT